MAKRQRVERENHEWDVENDEGGWGEGKLDGAKGIERDGEPLAVEMQGHFVS